MKIGIIGHPQSGKTTMFKVLLQQDISGNIGMFRIEDFRIEKISKIFSSKKTTYPEFTFVDLGVISGFDKKRDLDNCQDIDLFICAVDAFFKEDPKSDLESSITDYILSDLEVIQTRIARIQKEHKKGDAEQELKVLEKCQRGLSDGKLLWKAGLGPNEEKLISGLVLLSLKPLIVAINASDQDVEAKEAKIKTLEEYCRSRDICCIRFFGKIESELLELELEERKKFLKEMNIESNLREDISKLIFKELDLITFFTTGAKETRGCYLKSGLSVIEAAGKIHSDMKRGFIRAEVVNFEDFIKSGSIHKAREEGVLKVEGKSYVVRDGDIINVRFNV
ncbi:MAG: DUF933 domain-containing protein [Candidatus Omnitrophica bacterium]|nr:DUF933 domain-containing protein [Candidatus Omnitrophota bacterium]